MSRSPVLAVIIPSYNYERFVGRAIDSVLSQNREDVELIVVDDGSSDDSWSVITGFEGVRSVRIANGGQLGACILGLESTSAPFVLFLDADDELRPGSLNRIIAAIDAGVSKVQFALTRVDRDGSPIGGSPSLGDYRDSADLRRQVLSKGVYRTPPTSGNVFRRDLCRHLYDIDYDASVDGVILYIAPFFGDVVSIGDSLGLYRVHDRNSSGIGARLTPERMRRELNRFEGQMRHLNGILATIGYGADAVAYDSQFVVKERRFQIMIVEGTRPSMAFVADFLRHALNERIGPSHKAGICLLAILSLVMDESRMQKLMSYRLRPGRRSAFGFLRSALSATPAA